MIQLAYMYTNRNDKACLLYKILLLIRLLTSYITINIFKQFCGLKITLSFPREEGNGDKDDLIILTYSIMYLFGQP